jgi:formylglycine-generating enzyme required for sulfatase activity
MTISYVYRGGSWISNSGVCRSANRLWHPPVYRYNGLGFRVLRSSKEEVKYRVHQGGSWFDYSGRCRSASRDGLTPDIRLIILGFRIIKENKHDD